MSVDVLDLAAFYDSPLGAVAQGVVGRVLAGFWPDRRPGDVVLGIGYALPYLPAVGDGPGRALAFMPAAQGALAGPGAAAPAALVDPLILPLADETVDRALVAHALETAESPGELLHEVSRVLRPDGRAILVCPNRRGLWARMDTTPFGHGQPFSRSQLRRLMEGSFLHPERWARALFVPPVRSRPVLRGAAAWERLGQELAPRFAGLHVVEASKALHRPVPVRDVRRAARRRPVLAPVPAPAPAACSAAAPRRRPLDSRRPGS